MVANIEQDCKALFWSDEQGGNCILYNKYGSPIEDCRNGMINTTDFSYFMCYKEALDRCPGTIEISLKTYSKLRSLFFSRIF